MNVHTITTTIKGICAADPDEAVKAARRHKDGAMCYRYLTEHHATDGDTLDCVATAARWSLEAAASAMAVAALTTGDMRPGTRFLIADLARLAADEAATAARVAAEAFEAAYHRAAIED